MTAPTIRRNAEREALRELLESTAHLGFVEKCRCAKCERFVKAREAAERVLESAR